MRPSTGAYENHATLLALEFLAVPAAVLVTATALLLATGALTLADLLGGFLDVGAATLGIVADLVVLATFLVLVGLGGLAVVGYRRVLDERFGEVEPIPLLAVPVATIVVAVGYAAFVRETPSFPWWLFAVVAVAAYALAYRTIAIDSLLEGRRREGVVVGVVAAIPVVVTTVTVVDETLWSGTVSTTLLSATPGTDAGVTLRRAILVAVPLAVAALYGVDRVEDVRGATVPDWRTLAGRVTDRLPSVPTGRSKGRRSAGSSRRRSGRRRSVVPSSPNPSGSRKKRSGAGTASTDGSGSASASGRSRAAPSSDSRGRRSSSGGGHASGRSSSAGKRSSNAGGRPSSDDGGTGSDTRIFVDDFGDERALDETPVGVCPDCDKDIPSDGVYRFCPFCGHEL